ncbi:MAG TPA: carbon-nitrogen hydrolase family protein [Gemmatimonadaceae bacterium]|jgi:predicted amidohydrolase
MTQLRIALANLRPATTPDESVTLAVDAIRTAAERGAQIVCFPECYVPGYRTATRNLPPLDPTFLNRAWSTIARTAGESKITVVLGTERPVGSAARITTLVVNADGTTAGFQDKVQLDPSEEGAFVAGTSRSVFQIGDVTFGIVICHEGWRYPETARWAARHGAHIVFHPHYHESEGGFVPSAFVDPRNTFHEKAMLCRAAENTIYFASVNCALNDSPTTSAIIAPDGSVVAWQPYGEEGLLIADIDTSDATRLLASRCRTFVD